MEIQTLWSLSVYRRLSKEKTRICQTMNTMRKETKRGGRQGELPKREKEVPTKTTTSFPRNRLMMQFTEQAQWSNDSLEILYLVKLRMIWRSISTRLTRMRWIISSWQAVVRGLILSWLSNMLNKGMLTGMRIETTSLFSRTHLVYTSWDWLIREEGKKKMYI